MRYLILLTALVLVACGTSRPTDEECSNAWAQISTHVNARDYSTYDAYVEAFEADLGMQVGLILNREHAPDTVGYVLKECIQNGWDYREAAGLK